ncbi:MAG: glycosyltransferase [Phycisphaerales bacterium]
MKFLLTSVGSAGDIHPFVAIGRELAARGHDVWLLVNPYFEQTVRSAGLGFLPLGDEFDFKQKMNVPNAAHPRKGSMTVLRELLIVDAPIIINATQSALERVKPDAVIAHHISIGTPWLCERMRIPLITAVLAPALWFNDRDKCVYAQGAPENPPRWLMQAGMWLARRQMRWMYDRPVNRIRRDLGFAPARDMIFADATRGALVLGMWSPHFRAPMPGDPPTGVICGFPWHDDSPRLGTDAVDVLRFLDECDAANDPPLLFTLGTAIVHVAGNFYEHAAQACRALGRRGILLTNRKEYAPASLPSGVRAFHYAPFSHVMPRCAAVVHHGGIGTTAQGLRSGRPTLIVPHAYDQFDNAARAKRLGVSRTLWATRLNLQRLAAELRALVDDSTVVSRADSLGKRISSEAGTAAAANHVESFMRH